MLVCEAFYAGNNSRLARVFLAPPRHLPSGDQHLGPSAALFGSIHGLISHEDEVVGHGLSEISALGKTSTVGVEHLYDVEPSGVAGAVGRRAPSLI